MYADRIKSLPPYLFAAIDKAKNSARKRGVDVIDLGVGDPDLPTPTHIVEALCTAARDPANHRYPSYEGKLAFRQAVADWYRGTFKVGLDPETEVLALIGSKEGIAHAPLAFINHNDLALVPDPAYPVYSTSVLFAGGVPEVVPLIRENDFLPDLGKIDPETARKSKLIFLNFPNNPTGAVAGKEFFKELIDFARDYRIIVMHDNPYSEIYFREPAGSILEVEGAKDVAVEFHSLSKTYNMAGWRVGSVVGNPEVIAGIGQVKSNIDSGNFGAVQDAGMAALKSPDHIVKDMRQEYARRMEILYQALTDLGLEISRPRATFYLWAWTGKDSIEFCKHLLDDLGIVATPGVGFGRYGQGFVRFSVTQPTERIEMAVKRLSEWKS
ncbi:MAG: aminotransferase class I/II-fold pyridoxal phosphate-dependent enzyme [Methanosarcinales archaeon]|nr:aminotransferase class I/II-fold pyridoxal phosphate-dependent enzyme [Methanosarcinales archaeon]